VALAYASQGDVGGFAVWLYQTCAFELVPSSCYKALGWINVTIHGCKDAKTEYVLVM
jgi:hypothetical protein